MSAHAAVQKRQHDESAPQNAGPGKSSQGAGVGLPLFMQSRQTIGASENREGLATPALTQGETPSSGVANASIAFPHADTIRSALGAPVPGSAIFDQDACTARGVAAFTDRAVSYFATPTPSLRVAAHEGAHQIQHAGFSHDAGLGAEGHADTVARAE